MTAAPHTVSPTGEQWMLIRGQEELVVTEVGATLRSYRVGGLDVIDGFGPDEWAQGGRGQVLAPWPNRLGGGRYTFGEVTAQAALDEPERDNAIHGLVRWLPWELRAREASSVAAGCVLRPTPGYPFTLDLQVEYRLAEDGLVVTTTATNVGPVTLPFGVGFHPYLTAGAGHVDEWVLQLPTTAELAMDERGLPIGQPSLTAGTDLDFSSGRPVGPIRLDAALTGLRRDPDRRARALLTDPETARGIELWVDEQFSYLMCFTGDTLSDPSRRRRSMAIEPMSCPPDAFRSGQDLVVLEPGQHWQGAWGARAF
jgi:aldose 1-epimerase